MKYNKIWYLFSFLVVVSTNVFLESLTLENMSFILVPTNFFVERILHSQAEFISGEGYFHPELNIIIEKSCSGITFLTACLALLLFLILKHHEITRKRLFALPGVLISCYFLTIIVNTSRILLSIVGNNLANLFMEEQPHHLLHSIIGVFVYIVSLIIIYTSYIYIIQKPKDKHEKIT